ncbi:ester cyclase [Amnibacterium setariae]|uniref:Ester cyclase n=1 Tax=Amnibacterium setariae TaxID=2306585 RepID=A0A3A1U0C0_9MICO|nr:ester cyclase [Amnibacterium setariae]RIX28365.1 ester cyclase [Amnibacterium setariae]
MTEADDRAKTNLEAQGRMGEIVAAGEYDRLTEVLADGLVDHDPAPDQAPGPRGIGEFWTTFKEAFPDVALEPVQVIATEDFVTAVLEVSGTHRGEFLGHEATGKSFRVRGIQVGKFEDGKMTDRWGATDTLGILQQLGLA